MTALESHVRHGFAQAAMPQDLVDELLDTFTETKRRFYREDLRPSGIEGGRFSEVVFRVLQWASAQTYTALGTNLPKVPTLVAQLEQVTASPDSVRFHIPRALRVIYEIRNKRDLAHLGDGIDPNLQDATLVVRTMEWIMAELVRLFHNVPPAEAQIMIDDLVSKDVPLIQVFQGFPRVLKPLKASEHLLVLLYWVGAEGATSKQLDSWARPAMRKNLGRTMSQLDAKDLVHLQDDRWVLTRLGERLVEEEKLIEPA